MTDFDRGAYAPQNDGAFAFDARGPRERKPLPFTLIFSAIVLLALVAAVVMFYRGGVRAAGSPPETVGAPALVMKEAIAPQAEPMDPAESLDVYVERGEAPSLPVTATTMSPTGETSTVAVAPVIPAPAFTAPPEQPQPRPAPRPVAVTPAPVRTVPATPVPAVAAKPSQVAATPPVRTAPLPTARASQPTQTAGATPRPAAPIPAPIQVAAAPIVTAPAAPPVVAAAAPAMVAAVTPPPVAAATSGNFGVQIGAFSSQAMADSEFAKVAGGFGAASGKSKSVTPVAKDGSTLYRTVVTGFSREQAAALCAQMKASGRACFVKGS